MTERREEVVKRARAILGRQSDVAVSYLFGSRARGDERPGSDVDIAVLCGTGDLDDLALLADLSSALSPLNVDLVVLDDAPLELAYRVLREGIALTCVDEVLRVRFKARTIDRYLDMAPARAILAAGTARRIEDGRVGRP
ncbi:MAG: type VII toxin-antitoxin system MntA family adenylyltransferase antitoxin [Sporichthyaceae bacterium]